MEKELIVTNSEEETIEFGSKFAKELQPGNIVALYGDLGAGKTALVKGICNYFDVDDIVTSPTFTIINQYFGQYESEDLTIYHIDLYRIKNKRELEEIGFDDCMYSETAIKLVEWSEKAAEFLEKADYSVHIKLNEVKENERTFEIEKR